VPASRRHAALAAVVAPALLVACASTSPSPTALRSDSPIASVGVVPEPGRPYGAEDILVAMRESRRPDGVPDEIETDAIAAAVAEHIYTFDGEPWSAVVAGGSCGPETCTLEVGGTPDGALGEDLYAFSVTPSTGGVELGSADLRGLPADILVDLDAMARAGLADPPADLALLSASWLPPPDAGVFELAYRSGGEEGSCALNVTLDATTERVISQEATDC
jgi:hypothetical protein